MVNLMYFYGAFSVFTTARASHARQIFIANELLGTFLCALLPPSGQNHKMLNELVLLVFVCHICMSTNIPNNSCRDTKMGFKS